MRAKLFAIGLGIALLLPLSVYTGVNIISHSPDAEYTANTNYDEQLKDAPTKAAKQKLIKEEAARKAQQNEQEKRYQKRLFYVSFPVGSAAVILGAILTIRGVGSGLMFGGIILLTGGCYSYWDKLTAVTQFVSVLVALGVFITLGCLKGHRSRRHALGANA